MPGRGVIELISDFDDLKRRVCADSKPWRGKALAPCRSRWRRAFRRTAGASCWQQDRWCGRRRGTVMRGQVAPRAIGIMLGLRARCARSLPTQPIDALAELPLAARVAEMRKPEVRAQILAEQPAPNFKLFARLMADFEKVWVLGDPPDYEPAARAQRGGQGACRRHRPLGIHLRCAAAKRWHTDALYAVCQLQREQSGLLPRHDSVARTR